MPVTVVVVAGATTSILFHIQDRASGCTFLIDTGADISLIPASPADYHAAVSLSTLPHWWQPMVRKLKFMAQFVFHLNLTRNASKDLLLLLTSTRPTLAKTLA